MNELPHPTIRLKLRLNRFIQSVHSDHRETSFAAAAPGLTSSRTLSRK